VLSGRPTSTWRERVYEADLVGRGVRARGAVLAGDVRYERNLARRVTGGGSIDICGVAKKCNVA
jgi:hypothetical protein